MCLLGSCLAMTSALKGHGSETPRPSHTNNMARVREIGSALVVDLQNVTVSCFACSQYFHILHSTCSAGTANGGQRCLNLNRRAVDSPIVLVPGIHFNYPDCRRNTLGNHHGEGKQICTPFCSTVDSQPWRLVLFAMISHTWKDKPNWSWDTSSHLCWRLCLILLVCTQSFFLIYILFLYEPCFL